MKIFRFRWVVVSVFVFYSAASQVPAEAQNRGKKATRLPDTVRQMMPSGAKTVGIYRPSTESGRRGSLIHIWTTPRPLQPQDNDLKALDRESPYVMDFFNDTEFPTPQYSHSIVYGANSAPSAVSVRSFNNKIKRGIVYQVDNSTNYTSMEHERVTETQHRFFVFPYGIGRRGRVYPYTTILLTSSRHPDSYSKYDLFRAPDGELRIVRSSGGSDTDHKYEEKQTLVWNGSTFAIKK